MIELLIFLMLLDLAIICEYIDSAFGMGYGTILSPLLIIFGFEPLIVVPSILISQATGGLTASFFHNKLRNVRFSIKKSINKGFFKKIKKIFSIDFKTFLLITIPGVIATIFAAFIAINISKQFLKTYIGLLVLIMGLIMLFGFRFKYSIKKISLIGIISSFNKGISGGGFGPVVTSGQIMCGKEHKSSIGVTTLSEVPICFIGFLTYLIIRQGFDYSLAIPLILGSILAAPLGAITTQKLNKRLFIPLIGIFVILSGAWILIKTWLL